MDSMNRTDGLFTNTPDDIPLLTPDDLLAVSITPDGADGVVIVSPAGEIDTISAPRLRSAFLRCLVPGHTQVVLDLTEVSFLDSAGLTVLAEAQHRARTCGIALTLRAASRAALRPLQMTGLADGFAAPPAGPPAGPPRADARRDESG